MNPTFDHNLQASAICWVNNVLEKRGQAFYNVSENLTAASSDFNGYYSFLPSKPQMLYDSSIVGATIPSGCTVNSIFTARGVNGMSIDFARGQFLFTSNITSTVSATYSAREVNTYYTYDNVEALLFEKQNFVNPKNLPNYTRNDVDAKIVPAIYIKTDPGINEELCLGGMVSTQTQIKLIFVSNNDFIFQGVNSLFRDEYGRCFPILSTENLPFNGLGDLKNLTWNYETLKTAAQPNELVFIKDVKISTFNAQTNQLIGQNALGAIIYVTAELYRFPRAT